MPRRTTPRRAPSSVSRPRTKRASGTPETHATSRDLNVASAPAPRPGTKAAQLLALLGRPAGATLGDLAAATGWLPHAQQRRTGQRRPVPDVPAVPDPRKGQLKPGTLLVREHGGRVHRVMVLAQGFAFEGSTYASLSEIARLITGTSWNGPRFFGLRARRTSRLGTGPEATSAAAATAKQVVEVSA